jgi:hypothetical protein
MNISYLCWFRILFFSVEESQQMIDRNALVIAPRSRTQFKKSTREVFFVTSYLTKCACHIGDRKR